MINEGKNLNDVFASFEAAKFSFRALLKFQLRCRNSDETLKSYKDVFSITKPPRPLLPVLNVLCSG